MRSRRWFVAPPLWAPRSCRAVLDRQAVLHARSDLPAAAGCALPIAASALTAEAASVVQSGTIRYDVPGSDTATNTSVNGEYVTIKNHGTTARSLTGRTVRDAANHVFTSGTFSLRGGKSVVLRTGKGTNTSTTRCWRLGYHVWNATGDKAYLRLAAGTAMDYCAWTSNGSGVKTC